LQCGSRLGKLPPIELKINRFKHLNQLIVPNFYGKSICWIKLIKRKYIGNILRKGKRYLLNNILKY